jgi:hypothetical protein
MLTFLGWLGSLSGAALAVAYGGIWPGSPVLSTDAPLPLWAAAPVLLCEHLYLALLFFLPRVLGAVPAAVASAARRRAYQTKRALFELRLREASAGPFSAPPATPTAPLTTPAVSATEAASTAATTATHDPPLRATAVALQRWRQAGPVARLRSLWRRHARAPDPTDADVINAPVPEPEPVPEPASVPGPVPETEPAPVRAPSTASVALSTASVSLSGQGGAASSSTSARLAAALGEPGTQAEPAAAALHAAVAHQRARFLLDRALASP